MRRMEPRRVDGVLAVARRVAAAAAVAEPDVEVAVGPDGELAAVVVGEGLLDEEQLPPAVLVDPLAVAQRVLDDDRVAVGLAGVVEVDLATVARERHAEEAALALVDHLGRRCRAAGWSGAGR